VIFVNSLATLTDAMNTGIEIIPEHFFSYPDSIRNKFPKDLDRSRDVLTAEIEGEQ
jgi:hypothetical protein